MEEPPPTYQFSRFKQKVFVQSSGNKYNVLMGRHFRAAPRFDGITFSTFVTQDGQHVCKGSTPLSVHQTANDLHVPVSCTCKSWLYLGLAPVRPAANSTTAARTLQQSRLGCKHMKAVREQIRTDGIASIPIERESLF